MMDPKNENLPEWLTQFIETAVTVERVWQLTHEHNQEKVDFNKITLLIEEHTLEADVNADPFDLTTIQKIIESPFGVGHFQSSIEKLLAEVDEAIETLGGNRKSKKWNKRDVTEILAEARAYREIVHQLKYLTRPTKKKLFLVIESELAQKKAPRGMTLEEQIELVDYYEKNNIPQKDAAANKFVSRSTLVRALRTVRAHRAK